MKRVSVLLLGGLLGLSSAAFAVEDVFISQGRTSDPTAKILSEMRDSDRRKIPLEVAMTARARYAVGDAIPVTVTITNLFDPPLLLNGRLLVNHRRLPGEVSFSVTDPTGKRCEFQRLVSPMPVGDDQFILLARGMSIQRTVDLADFFAMHKKGIYKVQAIYHNELDLIVNGSRAWMGQVVSDVNEIELQ